MKIELQCPSLPNFVKAKCGDHEWSVSIADVTDADLLDLADRWKRALLASAANKRERARMLDTRIPR